MVLFERKIIMRSSTNTILAVSKEDFEKWGCPCCGYRSGLTTYTSVKTSSWYCGECNNECCILDDVKKSDFFIGDMCPSVQKHPRYGTPKRGRIDTRPSDGSEFFEANDIFTVSDSELMCFACKEKHAQHVLTGFARCKEAGIRITQLFSSGSALLRCEEKQPDRVEIEIGVCDQHKVKLEKLFQSICRQDYSIEEWVINKSKVIEATS